MNRREFLNRRWRLQVEIRSLELQVRCSSDDAVWTHLIGLRRELVAMNRKLANERRTHLRLWREGVSQ